MSRGTAASRLQREQVVFEKLCQGHDRAHILQFASENWTNGEGKPYSDRTIEAMIASATARLRELLQQSEVDAVARMMGTLQQALQLAVGHRSPRAIVDVVTLEAQLRGFIGTGGIRARIPAGDPPAGEASNGLVFEPDSEGEPGPDPPLSGVQ